MRAVTWHGRRSVSVDTVPDPQIKEPTDAIIRVTSTNICGSDRIKGLPDGHKASTDAVCMTCHKPGKRLELDGVLE